MMKNAPNLWSLGDLVKHSVEGNVQAGIGGRWYPARPSGFYSIGSRLRCAWLVFTGKADAVTWPAGQ